MSELVQLNVGGTLAITTRITLCAQGGTLAAMFSGNMVPTLLHDAEGRYFIDRDGTHFGVVLNFLRDGRAALPTCRFSLEQLRAEAEFYNLPGLIAGIDFTLSQQQAQAIAAYAQQGAQTAAVQQAATHVAAEVAKSVKSAATTVQKAIGKSAAKVSGEELDELSHDYADAIKGTCSLDYLLWVTWDTMLRLRMAELRSGT